MTRRVLLTGRGPIADDLAAGLTDAGAAVAVRDLTDVTRPSIADQVSTAVAELGGLDAVVHVQILAAVRRSVVETSATEWAGSCEDALQAAVHLGQEVHAPLAASGGHLLFVIPTIGMSGASGLAGSAAAAEGIRILAKGLAKQWGHHGIRVNTVAVAPQLMLDASVGAQVAAEVALAAPALGEPGDPRLDIAPILAALTGDELHFVTGSTVYADGGVWMGS